MVFKLPVDQLINACDKTYRQIKFNKKLSFPYISIGQQVKPTCASANGALIKVKQIHLYAHIVQPYEKCYFNVHGGSQRCFT